MKYDVILADPPWRFKVWNEKTGSGKSASQHYPTMSLKDILDLPVRSLVAEKSVLFLWGIWSMLPESLEVMKAWGFTYKTEAWVWVKNNKTKPGFSIGTGYYTRANTEFCLLGTTEKILPRVSKSEIALIVAPKMAHSRKPEEQYKKIEALYPDRRYLELFARRKRPGWDSWGNEIESDINLSRLAKGRLKNVIGYDKKHYRNYKRD